MGKGYEPMTGKRVYFQFQCEKEKIVNVLNSDEYKGMKFVQAIEISANSSKVIIVMEKII